MSTVVIVESPAKAKTIEKYLGKGYTVAASVGHVRDLPKSNKNAIDIDGGFVPQYQIVAEKKKVIADLKKLAKKADEVILATDPDREGEAIAWHLQEVLDLKKPKRIVFHEITKHAVEEALQHPRAIDEQLKNAQEARRVLDRLVGYDLSGLIWKKVRYGLSAGRVQSPALRILAEREREIKAFTPTPYWTITGTFTTVGGDTFSATCVEEPTDETVANTIIAGAEKDDWHVGEVSYTKQKRATRPPFTTSTLQQVASTRLGFSPSRTMRVAQRLYEAGLITYMRTDSTNLNAQAQGHILGVIKEEFGENYTHPTRYASKSKNAQEAHEAIRPTDIHTKTAGANEEQHKLYELIWRRAVASQMKAAEVDRTRISCMTDVPGVPEFRATGSRITFPGWLAADPKARGEDVELPTVEAEDKLKLENVSGERKETTPPPRYSEAGLVRELEKRGIGRPSTYASIINTLEERGYVTKENRTLIPTDTGDVVSGFLEENFGTYIADDFTSEMENELDEIARGEREYAATLKDFYAPFKKDVEKKAKEAKKITDLGPAPKEFPCPKCGSAMVIKLGRSGKFLSCGTFPDCDGARTITGEEIKEPDALGIDPETGERVFVLDGPYGAYVQLGAKEKGSKKKPKRASIPKDIDATTVTLEQALKYLALPRLLGKHPETEKDISASIGRFGPYIVHDGDFRSLKEDDVYTITLDRALEILKEPKKRRGWGKRKK